MAEEDFDIYKDLQLITLQNHIQPNEETFYRKLCRWFSAEFHTSIFEVEQKPIEYLLIHYFEQKLEKMSPEEFVKYKRFLLYKEEILAEEEEDELFAEQIEQDFIRRKQAELDQQNKAKEQQQVPKELPPNINKTF